MNAPITQQFFPYTPLEEAVALLHSRRTALSINTGNMLERHFAARPYAVLFRNVATPNFELERFVALAVSANLIPLVLEFPQDKFVTRNPAKKTLARMSFYAGIGRNGGPLPIRVLTITNLNAADSLPFPQIATIWGQGFIPFHHEMLRSRSGLHGVEIVDASPFLLAHSGGARHYYPEFFSLFVRHAVLFESFLYTTPSDKRFTTEIVIPAFNAASARHGCHPLICRLDPPESEGHPYWYQYPDELHKHVAAKLASARTREDADQ